MPLCRSIQIAFFETIDVTTINPKRNRGLHATRLLLVVSRFLSKIRPSPHNRLECDDKKTIGREISIDLFDLSRGEILFPASPFSGRTRLLEAPVQSSRAQVRARRVPSERRNRVSSRRKRICLATVLRSNFQLPRCRSPHCRIRLRTTTL